MSPANLPGLTLPLDHLVGSGQGERSQVFAASATVEPSSRAAITTVSRSSGRASPALSPRAVTQLATPPGGGNPASGGRAKQSSASAMRDIVRPAFDHGGSQTSWQEAETSKRCVTRGRMP